MDENTQYLNPVSEGYGSTTNLLEKRYTSKWNVLFHRGFSQWMSVNPQENLLVYPCYVCRDIFGRKNSFIEHINRRAMVIKYNCPHCPNRKKIFYNPCSFLLHTRDHFSLSGGEIDLDNVEISLLPIGLAGIFHHSDVQQLYDVPEDALLIGNYANSKFYSPYTNNRGKRIVMLKPFVLVFLKSAERLVLKQVCSNIPCCKFIKLSELENDGNAQNTTPQQVVGFKNKVDESSKNDNIAENKTLCFAKCPECNEVQNCKMTKHFIGTNKPKDDLLKCSQCKYVAATSCSLKAHERIHTFEKPHVCPECGKDFEREEEFKEHLEELCFHLAKTVRFKCPGKRCRKIFATYNAFSHHFGLHLFTFFKCTECDLVFYEKTTYEEHLKSEHDSEFNPENEFFTCNCCAQSAVFCKSNYLTHIEEHCNDPELKVYAYGCKYCKAFCRSRETYAMHVLKCPRNTKNLPIATFDTLDDDSTCKFCHSQFTNRDSYIDHLFKCIGISNENQSLDINDSPDNSFISAESDVNANEDVKCVLCNKIFSSKDIGRHLQLNASEGTSDNTIETCKYQKPVVLLNPNISESTDITTPTHGTKRKNSTSPGNNKKTAVETNVPLKLEAPRILNGIYHCAVCNFENTDRDIFQQHLIKHRDLSSMPYFCMECGEGFIVKLSLIKHLNTIHKITNFKIYFKNNKCFNEEEIKKEADSKNDLLSPLKDYQCDVCRSQFSNDLELRKHIRMHGMAFLKVNKKL